MTAPLWLTRPATPADLGYVWDAFSKQLARRECTRWAEQPGHGLPAELVQRRERTLARYILGDAFCTVAYPVEPERAHLVCGFVIFDPLIRTVHYAYTGRNLRRMGIASALLSESTHGWEVVHASHLTKAGRALAARLNLRVRYDPYRAFFARDSFVRKPHGSGGSSEIGHDPDGDAAGRGAERPDAAAGSEAGAPGEGREAGEAQRAGHGLAGA